MRYGFTISEFIPAKASQIYEAWLSSEGHAAITGYPAQVDGRIGGQFTAWNGYISGCILELTPNERIVQAWRTAEFPQEAPDSRLEIYLEELGEGTKVILSHSGMPEDQVESYRQGWEDFYFKPMKEYFGAKPFKSVV